MAMAGRRMGLCCNYVMFSWDDLSFLHGALLVLIKYLSTWYVGIKSLTRLLPSFERQGK